MPNNQNRGGSYFKNTGKPTKSRGLFDLPDGSHKDVKRVKGQGQRPQSAQNPKSYQKNYKRGFGDLPSGAGKKEAIERQKQFAKEREIQRRGDDNKKSDVKSPIFSNSVSYTPAKQGKNLEKDASRSRLDTARFYVKEIGYHVKPILLYFIATFIFVLLGALGKLNGIDLRIPCTIVYAFVLTVGGISVNRYMSASGFGILVVINTLGALLGHAGVLERSNIFIQRLIKLLNTPYFVFDTGNRRYDSVVLLVTIAVQFAFVYFGSGFHYIKYKFRKDKTNNDEEAPE